MGGIGQPVLIAIEEVIEGGDAADPVAIPGIAEALDVVLFAGKVPHEVAEVHPARLVVDEVFDVIGHGWLGVGVHAGEAFIGIDLVAEVGGVPHTGKEMGGGGVGPVLSIFFSGYLVFVRAFHVEIACFDGGGGVGEVGAIEDGPVAVIFATEVAYQANGVVYVKHVHAGVGIAADHGREIGRVAEQHKGGAPQADLEQVEILFYGIADAEDEGDGQEDEKGRKAGEKGQVKAVDEENIEGAGAFDGILDHEDLDDAGKGAASEEGQEGSEPGRFIAFKIIDHHDGGDGQQVEEVDADGEAHHVEDKDDPFICAGFVGLFFPFEDGPEDDGGEEGGGGVDFAFHGAIPEGVAEGIGERPHHPRCQDQERLLTAGSGYCLGGRHEFAGEMGDSPEQEEDGEAAGDGAHEIHAAGSGMGVIAKEDDEEAPQQDKKGCSGRVGNLEFIAAGDKFAAVPEAAGRLHGEDVNGAGDNAYNPARKPIEPGVVIRRAICLHVNKLKSIIFFCSNRVPEGRCQRISGLYMNSALLVRF